MATQNKVTVTLGAAKGAKPVLKVGANGVCVVGGNTQWVVGKAYHPRANTQWGNAATWALVQQLLASGPQTGSALCAAAAQRNHATALPYFVKMGCLVPAPQQAAK